MEIWEKFIGNLLELEGRRNNLSNKKDTDYRQEFPTSCFPVNSENPLNRSPRTQIESPLWGSLKVLQETVMEWLADLVQVSIPLAYSSSILFLSTTAESQKYILSQVLTFSTFTFWFLRKVYLLDLTPFHFHTLLELLLDQLCSCPNKLSSKME